MAQFGSSGDTSDPWLPATISHIHTDGRLDIVYEDGEIEFQKLDRRVEVLDLDQIAASRKSIDSHDDTDLASIIISIIILHLVFSLIIFLVSFISFQISLNNQNIKTSSSTFLSLLYFLGISITLIISLIGNAANIFFCYKLYPVFEKIRHNDLLEIAVASVESTTHIALHRQEMQQDRRPIERFSI